MRIARARNRTPLIGVRWSIPCGRFWSDRVLRILVGKHLARRQSCPVCPAEQRRRGASGGSDPRLYARRPWSATNSRRP